MIRKVMRLLFLGTAAGLIAVSMPVMADESAFEKTAEDVERDFRVFKESVDQTSEKVDSVIEKLSISEGVILNKINSMSRHDPKRAKLEKTLKKIKEVKAAAKKYNSGLKIFNRSAGNVVMAFDIYKKVQDMRKKASERRGGPLAGQLSVLADIMSDYGGKIPLIGEAISDLGKITSGMLDATNRLAEKMDEYRKQGILGVYDRIDDADPRYKKLLEQFPKEKGQVLAPAVSNFVFENIDSSADDRDFIWSEKEKRWYIVKGNPRATQIFTEGLSIGRRFTPYELQHLTKNSFYIIRRKNIAEQFMHLMKERHKSILYYNEISDIDSKDKARLNYKATSDPKSFAIRYAYDGRFQKAVHLYAARMWADAFARNRDSRLARSLEKWARNAGVDLIGTLPDEEREALEAALKRKKKQARKQREKIKKTETVKRKKSETDKNYSLKGESSVLKKTETRPSVQKVHVYIEIRDKKTKKHIKSASWRISRGSYSKNHRGSSLKARMLPGRYIFTISAQGYKTFKGILNIKPGKKYRKVAALMPIEDKSAFSEKHNVTVAKSPDGTETAAEKSATQESIRSKDSICLAYQRNAIKYGYYENFKNLKIAEGSRYDPKTGKCVLKYKRGLSLEKDGKWHKVYDISIRSDIRFVEKKLIEAQRGESLNVVERKEDLQSRGERRPDSTGGRMSMVENPADSCGKYVSMIARKIDFSDSQSSAKRYYLKFNGAGSLRISIAASGKHQCSSKRYSDFYRNRAYVRLEKNSKIGFPGAKLQAGNYFPGVINEGRNSATWKIKKAGVIKISVFPESGKGKEIKGVMQCWSYYLNCSGCRHFQLPGRVEVKVSFKKDCDKSADSYSKSTGNDTSSGSESQNSVTWGMLDPDSSAAKKLRQFR